MIILMRFHHFSSELTLCLWMMVSKESIHEHIMEMVCGSRKKSKRKKIECKFLSQQIELKFVIYNFMK
jgi:hypothetical protein